MRTERTLRRIRALAALLALAGCSGRGAGTAAMTVGEASAPVDASAPRDSALRRDVRFVDARPAIDGTLLGKDGSTARGDGATSAKDARPSRDGAKDGGPGEPTEQIHFIGRFDTRDAQGPRFAWPGTAIAATFTGTGVAVKLQDAGTNYFVVVIDGGKPNVVPTSSATSTYPLASGLPSGKHTVMLTKRTESFVGVVQFLGFTVTAGALVDTPYPYSRRIEYVGDSISCGYGDLGAGPGCHFSAATEDETIAYDDLAATAQTAQQTVIAYSGIGVLENSGGGTTGIMADRFGLALADDPTSTWAFTTPEPEVVVINLGTNDFWNGDPGAGFQTAYVSLVQQIRKEYGTAQIVCTLSPLLGDPSRTEAANYIQGAISTLKGAGDDRLSYFEFDEQLASDGYGCDYHPSPVTHQKMAIKLEPVLRTLTGW